MRLLLIGIIFIPIFCQSSILSLDRENPIISSLSMRNVTFRNNIDFDNINVSDNIQPEYIWENSTSSAFLFQFIYRTYYAL